MICRFGWHRWRYYGHQRQCKRCLRPEKCLFGPDHLTQTATQNLKCLWFPVVRYVTTTATYSPSPEQMAEPMFHPDAMALMRAMEERDA